MKGLNDRGASTCLSNWRAAVLNRCIDFAQRALPATCVLCGALADRQALCSACEAALPALPVDHCAVCAVPLTSGAVCGACTNVPPHYERVTAIYAYDFPVDAMIHAYKYGGRLALAPLFAHALAHAVSGDVDAIVPMPLGPARLRERGFNQAHEIARCLGRRLHLPVAVNACRKVSDTPPQAALPWKERAKNVRGAFVCDADFAGQRVAIVDDVMTTGATLNELAKSLKRGGAAEVYGWVVARTLPSEMKMMKTHHTL